MSHQAPTLPGARVVRRYPADLAAVSIGAVAFELAIVGLSSATPLRVLLAVALIGFLPGYALVSALFPARAGQPDSIAPSRGLTLSTPRGIDTVERLALSVATSFVLTTLVVFALAGTRWGLTPRAVSVGLVVVTVLLAQLAVLRRARCPEGERFRPSTRRVRASLGAVLPGHSRSLSVASAVLVAGIALTAVAFGLAFAAPQSGDGYTQFALFTEDDDGSLVADGYPTTLERGESASLTLVLENHEGSSVDYTVVAQAQTVNDGTVADRIELDRFEARVDDGETARIDHDLALETPGEDVRIAYLLFHGDPPDSPTVDDADDAVHIWVTVT